MIHFIRLIRPEQWLKNTFLFLPAFFSGTIYQSPQLIHLLLAFVAFCFLSSSVYIINDFFDIEKDKLHPEKKNRPLASGKISPLKAFTGMAILLLCTVIIATVIIKDGWLQLVMASYFIMNLAYSARLKNIALLDINIIALGFMARILAGGIVSDLIISKWLWIMTYLLALILALGKRRSELIFFIKTGIRPRKAISGYSLEFINAVLIFMSSVLVVSYIMYSVSTEVIIRLKSDYVYVTSFFVILGITRFLQQTLVYNKSGNPTHLLISDRFLQSVVLLWVIAFVLIIYGPEIH